MSSGLTTIFTGHSKPGGYAGHPFADDQKVRVIYRWATLQFNASRRIQLRLYEAKHQWPACTVWLNSSAVGTDRCVRWTFFSKVGEAHVDPAHRDQLRTAMMVARLNNEI